MSEHFIKEIEIKEYKLFKDFKAKGFGRVNLIGGKNNVGKTAFMEACYLTEKVDTYDIISANILYIHNIRNDQCSTNITGLDFKKVLEGYKKIEINTNLNNLLFEFFNNKLTYTCKLNNIKINLSNFFEKGIIYQIPTFINFLPSSNINNKFLANEFDKIKKLRLRDELNNELGSFDTNIVEFEIIDGIPQVYINSIEDFVYISVLGHGFKRYLALIMLILSNKNSIIYLDEIENGIHYTNFDKLWELILTISKEQNVQIFATTHSKECIESYARVSKKLQDNEITFIELGKNKQKQIRAIVMDSERFHRELDTQNEVRGW